MKSESINTIKKQLLTLEPQELTLICLRLAKYKKETKELLSYLVFECKDESQYVANVQAFCLEMFQDFNVRNSYVLMKGLRKTAKQVVKYMKFTENEVSKVEILIYFIELAQPIVKKNDLLNFQNFYISQYKKLDVLYNKLQEDYQYDFKSQMEKIRPTYYY